MTDCNSLTERDDDFYRPDPRSWVQVDQINGLRIYQKIIGATTLPLVVSSAMDCGALTYRAWVEKIEGKAYSEVCRMFAKGVSG